MAVKIRTIVFFSFVLLSLIIPLSAAYSDKAVSLYNAGLGLIKSGNYSESDEAFDAAVSLEPGYFEALNGKADALNRAGQYDKALAASDRALAINPGYGQGWINRGYILYNLGRYEDELRAYEKAIELDPQNADAWFNRGYSLAGMGRYDDALKSFDRVAELNPAYPNLAANRRIAENNAEAAKPVWVRYAPVIVAVGIIFAALLVLLLWMRKEGRKGKRKK